MISSDQFEAVWHEDGPMAVIAPTGTGKSMTLLYRYRALADNGVDPESILVFTHDALSAARLREQYIGLFDYYGMPDIKTINDFAFSLVERYEPDGIICFPPEERMDLLKVILGFTTVKNKKAFAHIWGEDISRFKRSLLKHPEDFDSYSCPGDPELFASLFNEYTFRMTENNRIDFDDVIRKAYDLLGEERVVRALQSEISYILIDEVQDMNRIQWEIIKRIGIRNISVFGDPDTSICHRAGGDLNILCNFKREFADAKIIRFNKNYRSASKIIEASQTLMSHDPYRGSVTVKADKDIYGEVLQLHCRTYTGELKSLLEKIYEKASEGFELSDMAVLVRSSWEMANIADVLCSNSIPFRVNGTVETKYKHPLFRDIYAYHNVAEEVKFSNADLSRVIRHPSIGSPSDNFEDVKELSVVKETLLKDTSHVIDKEQRMLARANIEDLFHTLDLIRGKSPVETMDLMVSNHYRQHFKLYQMADEDTYNYLWAGYREDALRCGDSWVAWNKFRRAYNKRLDDPVYGGITLSTIDRTKGCEWPVIFIPNCVKGNMPQIPFAIEAYSKAAQTRIVNEERRMLYQAMTRAKEEIVILSYDRCERDKKGKRILTKPSPLLREMIQDDDSLYGYSSVRYETVDE